MNNLTLAGRLTRDPESRSLSGDTKLASFGFAVSNRKKNAQTGQYEDAPMFIDCKAFNRTAETIERFLRKGAFAVLSGRLDLETWDDKATGAKRSKHVMIVNEVTLGPRVEPGSAPAPAQRPSAPPAVDDTDEVPF